MQPTSPDNSRINSEENNRLLSERNEAKIIRNIDKDKELDSPNSLTLPILGNERNLKVTVAQIPAFIPPDGGCRAWTVMLASFLCNGIIFGLINSCGLLFVHIKENLESVGDDNAAVKSSFVGSLAIGTTFFLSTFAGILTDTVGLRITAVLGGVMATLGMLLSSFANSKVEYLYLTYGLLFGAGASLAYTPSLVILGHYFKRYMGFVNGFVTAGSSVFTIIMPYVIQALLDGLGLNGCFRVLAAIMSMVIVCGFLFIPLMPSNTNDKQEIETDNDKSCGHSCSLFCTTHLINVDIWKSKKYIVWTLAIPSALFGYFVPYVHLVQYVKDILPDEDGKELVLCIGITSGLGRLIFGKIADFPKINRIRLQQISFVSIGILTMLLTVARSFLALVVIALGMGLFDGCFISLLGPIAFDICGPRGASQAIGFLLGLCSIPLTIGPPIAGYLYECFGSYQVAFLLAGIPPIVGACLMFLIDYVDGPSYRQSSSTSESLNKYSSPKTDLPNGVGKNEYHCTRNGNAVLEVNEITPLTTVVSHGNSETGAGILSTNGHIQYADDDQQQSENDERIKEMV